MDRNSITGIIVICAIMFAWMWYAAPGKEELVKQQRAKDSLELVQKQRSNEKPIPVADSTAPAKTADSVTSAQAVRDTVSKIHSSLLNKYGQAFAAAASDSNAFYTLENKRIKATISKKGGRICSVQLKEYRTHDSLPLMLFDPDSSAFGLEFTAENGLLLETDELYFQPIAGKNDSMQMLSMRLYAHADSVGKSNKYIEYQYSLDPDSYMLGCKLNIVNMEGVIASNTKMLGLKWKMSTPTQEKDIETQQQNSTIYFKYVDAVPDYIAETSDETVTLDAKVKWVGFKQQFFTSVLIADEHFEKSGADVSSLNIKGSPKYVKSYSTNLAVPYAHLPGESFAMHFYFGPNHFQTMKKYDMELERQIALGWSFAPIGWVNRFLVFPVFNFLDSFNLNYAIIILCLTLVFKTLLFPVAYKTYVSAAKMRVLRPEIEEINAKFGNEDAMKKQQATMALYKKAGVSPLAGCIPALLQMPILLALFRFFPASIEIRQQGFWWVTDLSMYDSILDFGPVPDLVMTLYGDHISLWAILCTVTTLIYTHLNTQMMSNPSQQQMPGMKYMIYLMPIIFLPFLNKFSAGLSFYYTLANIISFGQMFVIRYFVDEKKLHAQIEEHKKKPAKPASGFQQKLQKRLEEAQRQRSNGATRPKAK